MRTISEHYRSMQAQLHAQGNYGLAAVQYGPLVGKMIQSLGINRILDYGCGSKRSLLTHLNLPDGVLYEGYDPAIPEYSADPKAADLVVCIDVLEHIEPDFLENVLDHLASLCDPFGFFTIHTGPAKKWLADGRNAHIIQEGPAWWLPQIEHRFELMCQQPVDNGFAVLVRARNNTTDFRKRDACSH